MSVDVSFGNWLKQYRRAKNLSQSDLARQVGCAEVTIRKIEADERRPGYQIAERLAECLEVAPADREAFLRFARGIVTETAPPIAAAAPSLPATPDPGVAPQPADQPAFCLPEPSTPLIGRAEEVARARNLLAKRTTRVLTLTGFGGIGKTRLALQVARELADQYEHGACFVALASISDEGLVAATIAQALGVQELTTEPLLESLKAHLHTRHLLLVLDNFEQILLAAPLVAELLQAAPRLQVIVTSRAPLRLSGEYELAVPPLAFPALATLPPLAELMDYPAVELFIRCVQRNDPQFSVAGEHVATLVEICQRLDGLPLAIELAAARCKLLSLPGLLARLSSRLSLLTGGPRDLPPRQQTLRRTIEWSYALLQPPERRLFARLSVFVDGCTIEAAEQVAGMEPGAVDELVRESTLAAPGLDPVQSGAFLVPDGYYSTLDGVQSLLDSSLLWQERGPDGEPRFGMLEMIREYAQLQLAVSGEEHVIRRRHAAYYLAQVEQCEGQLVGPRQAVTLDRLEREYGNLRAVLDWCQTTGNALAIGLSLAGSLGQFWELRGYHSEGRQRLAALLALAEDRPGLATPRARALNTAGRLAWYLGDLEAASGYYAEGLALFRRLGDRQGVASVLNHLGNIAISHGDLASARELYGESLALRRKLGDQRGVAAALNNLGNVAMDQGDYAMARMLHEQSLAIRRVLGDKSDIAASLNNVGEILRWQGEHEQAEALFSEGLALCRTLDFRWGIAFLLSNLGLVSLYQGRHQQAQERFEESLRLFRVLENKQGIAIATDGLGRVAHGRGEPVDAMMLYAASLRGFYELREHRKVASLLEQIADLALSEANPSGALRAVRLFGATDALREAIGVPRGPIDRRHYAEALQHARQVLGEDAFAVAWQAGRSMTSGQAVALALEEYLSAPGDGTV